MPSIYDTSAGRTQGTSRGSASQAGGCMATFLRVLIMQEELLVTMLM